MAEKSRATRESGPAAADRCAPRDWVEVEYLLLEPADRAPGLPADTAATPLVAWVKGFALAAAAVGEELEVETMTGRRVHGRLTAVGPGYSHTFGTPPPELARVGFELRQRIAAYRDRLRGVTPGGAR